MALMSYDVVVFESAFAKAAWEVYSKLLVYAMHRLGIPVPIRHVMPPPVDPLLQVSSSAHTIDTAAMLRLRGNEFAILMTGRFFAGRGQKQHLAAISAFAGDAVDGPVCAGQLIPRPRPNSA